MNLKINFLLKLQKSAKSFSQEFFDLASVYKVQDREKIMFQIDFVPLFHDFGFQKQGFKLCSSDRGYIGANGIEVNR